MLEKGQSLMDCDGFYPQGQTIYFLPIHITICVTKSGVLIIAGVI